MLLSDEEIEKKIEKTVYKLEKFYKLYNFIYKIKEFFKKIKEFLIKNFLLFLITYTIVIYIIMKIILKI